MSDLLGTETSATVEQPAQDQAAQKEASAKTEAKESERPAWLPENFKTPEDLVASYFELGKKIREKTEPPEKYDVPADLQFQAPEALLAAFKDARMTQDQAAAALAAINSTLIPALAEAKQASEMNKLAQLWTLSPDSEAFKNRRAQVARWAKENVDSAVVDVLRTSAEGVLALEKMMQAAVRSDQTTPTQGAGVSPGLTMKDVNAMVADPRYGVDLNYTAWVESRVAEATKNGPLPS